MTSLLLALLAGLAPAAPASDSAAHDAWRRYADCAAVHYADADLVDLTRTAAMKARLMSLGRRYGATATTLRHTEVGDPKDKAVAYTKAYIMERARGMARHTQVDLQPLIAACPAPEG